VKYQRVTIQDVAKAAGVSFASVSAVLNGNGGKSIRVGKETRERILAVAKNLGYVPNQMARNLKSGSPSLIAVFTYESIFPVESKSEFNDFFVGIEQEAEKLGFDLLILNAKKAGAPSSRITQASGGVMIGLNRDDEDIKTLARRNFPLVFVGRRDIPGVDTHWVSFDYASSTREIISLLDPKEGDSVAYLLAEGSETEPTKDKERVVHEELEKRKVECRRVTVGSGGLKDEAQNLLLASSAVIADRLSLMSCVEVWKEGHPEHKMRCAVLEDDWQGLNAKWLCWENRRRDLGRLAVDHLANLIGGKSTQGLPRLVDIPVVKPEGY
jgi:DNA-binding LacI/PurR family transcriptional regulator